MLPLQNAKILCRAPLIVTADAITATPHRQEYCPQETHCILEDVEYVIEMGMARGANLPSIQIGESMLMQLRPL